MAQLDCPLVGSRWRHRKRGTVYCVLHIGTLQTSECPALDDGLVVIYENETHYAIWARPLSEFMDGRFEPVVTG